VGKVKGRGFESKLRRIKASPQTKKQSDYIWRYKAF